MDKDPHGYPFAMLLTERCLLSRQAKGTGEDMDTDGSLTDGQSSDGNYSLAGDE